MADIPQTHAQVAIIGGGPAGLMTAEILGKAGLSVTVYDRMPSVGRKLLMAGRGGLNLTHSEPLDRFITRYGAAATRLKPIIDRFPPTALQEWCEGLGQPTFVGSSGRVFPTALKASPLLRAWLSRLEGLGVRFALRRQWMGWDNDGLLTFKGPDENLEHVKPNVTVLALGGGSWPRLGSDGGWMDILQQQDIPVSPLRPSNCGFVVPWSDVFRERFEGQPLKPITLSFAGRTVPGEAIVTATGLEGGVFYALSAPLRDAIAAGGNATPTTDLRPGLSATELAKRLREPRGSQSLSTWLRKAGGLSPIAIGLLREATHDITLPQSPEALAGLIKALPIRLTDPCPIERAISTAGGIALTAVNDAFMLRDKPGVFAIGEMLDWEAPTGGYLLQATFSMAVRAAEGILEWLASQNVSSVKE